MIIPSGAQPIIDARKRGLKPAEIFNVSLVGKTEEPNPTVYANPGAEYDWRWLVGLQVVIYTKGSTNWKPITKAIAACRPKNLWLWDMDRYEGTDVYFFPQVGDIQKPKSQWRWNLDFLPWMPFQNEAFAWGN